MTRCSKTGCKFTPWRGRLCYQHAKEAAGFYFDSALGLFVRAGAAKADTARSATPPVLESDGVFPRTPARADVGPA